MSTAGCATSFIDARACLAAICLLQVHLASRLALRAFTFSGPCARIAVLVSAGGAHLRGGTAACSGLHEEPTTTGRLVDAGGCTIGRLDYLACLTFRAHCSRTARRAASYCVA